MPVDQSPPTGEPEPAFPRSDTNRYRKRPVVIEAVQFGYAEYADEPGLQWRFLHEPPAWLLEAVESGVVKFEFLSEDYWYFAVATLEGTMRGGPDDWLIRGILGELYPCADGIFQKTYEAA